MIVVGVTLERAPRFILMGVGEFLLFSSTLTHYLLQIVVAGSYTGIRIDGHVMLYKKVFHAGNIGVGKNALEIDNALTDGNGSAFVFAKVFDVPQMKATWILFEQFHRVNARLRCPA